MNTLHPTKVKGDYWLWAAREGLCCEDAKNFGKWLIFAGPDEIDALWSRIREATIVGELGEISKASTAKGFPKHGHYVICVYNKDYHDKAEIERIHAAIVALEIVPTRYKTDYETINGVPPDDLYAYQ